MRVEPLNYVRIGGPEPPCPPGCYAHAAELAAILERMLDADELEHDVAELARWLASLDELPPTSSSSTLTY